MSSTELPSLLTATASPKASAVRVAPGERLRSVRLPGITLSVRSRPPAREGLPPALYVHGLGGSSQNWSALMPLLDGLVDSEALDLPGFGDSPPPDDGNYSVTGHARAVIRYLDSAGSGPVHLFGNSLGGAIATRVAALRPDLVRTLTLVSPALPELRVQRVAQAEQPPLRCVIGARIRPCPLRGGRGDIDDVAALKAVRPGEKVSMVAQVEMR